MCRLDDRVAIVTGGARGIGAGVAVELGKRGATVVVNYLSNAQAANDVVAAIEEDGGQAMAVQADVSDFKEAEKLVKSAVEANGKLDILVNNAGLTRDQLIMLMPEEDWDLVIRVNLKSAYNCSKAAVRSMMRKRFGRIINMTSVAGIAGNPGQTNYCASKAGLIGFTRALARERLEELRGAGRTRASTECQSPSESLILGAGQLSQGARPQAERARLVGRCLVEGVAPRQQLVGDAGQCVDVIAWIGGQAVDHFAAGVRWRQRLHLSGANTVSWTVRPGAVIARAMPKSKTLMSPCSVKKTLPGLKSEWMIDGL